jgi:hypothetical protein
MGGVGAGIIAFPIAIRYLLEYAAWRGTLLVLSGVALNLCVCGAIMFPVAKGRHISLMPLLSCLPLRNVVFHGMCIANLFWSFGSTIVYIYLPSYAMDFGTDFGTAGFLISCIGMSAFMARMVFAFMGHNSALDDITSLLCSVGLGIVVTGICPLLIDDYAGQIGFAILFGFYSGYWTTFLQQATRELVGPEYLAMGNGYLSFMIALGSLLGGPSAGKQNYCIHDMNVQVKDHFTPGDLVDPVNHKCCHHRGLNILKQIHKDNYISSIYKCTPFI